jgi:CMP/dCMP kinase
MQRIVIAVDGHSSCGKSTLSKELAQKLHYLYIDSGAMYRAVALFALQQGLTLNNTIDETKLIEALPNIQIGFQPNEIENRSDTYLNGENVENKIRTLDVSALVSPVATIKQVREAMVKQQQELGKGKGIVMDGRDIGTVVFPGAELKIFMTASPEIRAQRRFDELEQRGIPATYQEILANVLERDHIDSTRAESPLRKADDAIVIDNSYLTREEQLNRLLQLVKEKLHED